MSPLPQPTQLHLQAVPGLIVIVGKQGKVLAVFGDETLPLGIDPVTAIGLDLQKIPNSPFKRRHVEQCLASGETTTVAVPLGDKQFECRITPVRDEAQEISSVVCYARDVTSEVTQQREIDNHRFEITAMNRIRNLEEVSSAIAHEINNPLTIIMGSSDAIRMSLEGQGDTVTRLQRFFTSIEKNGLRIKKIVSSLRDMARDGQEDALQEETAEALVSGALEFAKRQFDTAKLRIDFHIQTAGMIANVSSLQLMHAIEQVLLNAFEAASSQPEKWVKIAVTDVVGQIEVKITDSGLGIPQDLHQKIMQPFFSTRGVGKGMGIGLSLAKRVLEAHHGTILLNTASPHTQFVMTLPRLR